MRQLTFVCFLIIVGASALPAQTPPEVLRCETMVVGELPTQAWHLVRGEGFTFCLPTNWKPVGKGDSVRDARQWRGKAGWVKWGLGKPGPTSLVRVRGRYSSTGRFIQENQVGHPKTTDELIGGHSATLWIQQIDYRWFTGATWTGLPVWFQGEASDSQTGELALAIFRTVRFLGP